MILPLPEGAYKNAEPQDLHVFAKFNRIILNFFRIKNIEYENAFEGKAMVLPRGIQTDYHHTARIADAKDTPYATLIESRMANVYYHPCFDYLWKLTSLGFVRIRRGSKKALTKNGLIQ